MRTGDTELAHGLGLNHETHKKSVSNVKSCFVARSGLLPMDLTSCHFSFANVLRKAVVNLMLIN